ncbi:carbohydrate phosphatase [Echria macrotheca]|uniref:Carbohydrate phosphatase n=1 Tax=Echria macrotheca TaxID=438768 RepID=A0AAJ0BH56_9PEZI|nr:carbohydrate phosphatase [Echria macrotheca]
MTIKPYIVERFIAELAVQRVAILTRRVLSSALNRRRNSQISKSDASPVTVADFAVQALLISPLHAAFPNDTFVGEEDAQALRDDPVLAQQVWDLVSSTTLADAAGEAILARPKSIAEMCDTIDLGGRGRGGRTGRFWALDPIDGTASFIKNQQYAVALALVEDGREVLGVLGCPNLLLSPSDPIVRETSVDEHGLGIMLSAVRGHGALMRPILAGDDIALPTRIDRRVSSPKSETVSLENLHFIDSSLSAATLSDKVRELADLAGAPYPGTEIYSSHMRYAALILGSRRHVQVRFPASRRPPWCLWDHAGAQLIYTESGAGKITDLRGRPVDFGTGRDLAGTYGLIAADESIHGKILELVTDMLDKAGDRSPVEA